MSCVISSTIVSLQGRFLPLLGGKVSYTTSSISLSSCIIEKQPECEGTLQCAAIGVAVMDAVVLGTDDGTWKEGEILRGQQGFLLLFGWLVFVRDEISPITAASWGHHPGW